MKFAITKSPVSEIPVNELLSDVVRFSTRYQKLTPTEKVLFDSRLEQWLNAHPTKTATQTANLSGSIDDDNNETRNDSIINLWNPSLNPKPVPKPKPKRIGKRHR